MFFVLEDRMQLIVDHSHIIIVRIQNDVLFMAVLLEMRPSCWYYRWCALVTVGYGIVCVAHLTETLSQYTDDIQVRELYCLHLGVFPKGWYLPVSLHDVTTQTHRHLCRRENLKCHIVLFT